MNISRIKDAVNLPELIGEHVELKRMGPDFLGLCPFHQEKTPSFRVHQEYWKCFGCGAAGDAIDFVAAIEGISKGRAIRVLSERTGIPLDGKPPTRLQRAASLDDYNFARWWWRKNLTAIERQLTAYVLLATEEECDGLGATVMAFRALATERATLIAAAQRGATAQDWNDWREFKIECEDATWMAVAALEVSQVIPMESRVSKS